jgi:hypothetical protein
MSGVMEGNDAFLKGGTPRKGYHIAFPLVDKSLIVTSGAYPDEVRDIEGRRRVLPGCQRVIAGYRRLLHVKKATRVLNTWLSGRIGIFSGYFVEL